MKTYFLFFPLMILFSFEKLNLLEYHQRIELEGESKNLSKCTFQLSNSFDDTINDSLKNYKRRFYYFYNEPFFQENKRFLDSLFRKYQDDFQKYFDNNFKYFFYKKFYDYKNEFPKFEEFKDWLEEQEWDINLDSLQKKFRNFRERNLFNEDELIEI